MSLTDEQSVALIKRLEKSARENPQGYRFRVILLSLLGYAYIFFVLLCVAFTLYLLWLALLAHTGVNYLIGKLGWLVIGFAWIILRALWISLPNPAGLAVKLSETAELHALLNELTTALRSPPAHEVLLTTDFNAGIVQVPRFAFFGWPRNYLLLGLPLMAALSPQKFRAVLSHELGHLSGQHGRLTAWIYRVRTTWFQLLQRLEQEQHIGTFVFHNFLSWYAPFFNAYSFVLARSQEFEADRRAAELTTAETAARTLIDVEMTAKYLQESFWPKLVASADVSPEPPYRPFARMLAALSGETAVTEKWQTLTEALKVNTGYSDTHPCLRERLEALGFDKDKITGQQGDFLKTIEGQETAADKFLGVARNDFATRLDDDWIKNTAASWKARYNDFQASKARLAELNHQSNDQPLSADEAWQQITLTAMVNGAPASMPLLRTFLAQQPDHSLGNYALGQFLTDQNDAGGVAFLEKAMNNNPEIIIPCCAALYRFFLRQGDERESQCYLNRLEEQNEILRFAREERQNVTRKDSLTAHNLGAEEITRINQQLARYPAIRIAYFARKGVIHFPEKPFYVLAVELRSNPFKRHNSAALANQLVSEMAFPSETYIMVFNSGSHWLKKQIRRVPGAQIYPC